MGLALLVGLASPALAQDDPRKEAARSFDEGVQAYERAAFEEAARAFLRADALVPSDDALGNALRSAQRAGAWMLVVEGAERAISREQQSKGLASMGRRALADASAHVAKVELGCDPAPCSLELDGASVEPGERFLMPGTHVLKSLKADGAVAEERLSLAAGATYHVVLYPTQAGVAARRSEIKSEPTRPVPARRDVAKEPVQGSHKPLPPAVFYVGAAVTVALVGVTTWSGLDTLSAKRDLSERPTTRQVDDVRAKARRTDFLLAGSAVAAAATAYLGIALVDFSGERAAVGVTPLSPGAVIRGRF